MDRGIFEASSFKKSGYLHVLLITTGSVASIKAPLIVGELLQVRKTLGPCSTQTVNLEQQKFENVAVQVASTKSSLSFFSKELVEQDVGLPAQVRVWTDEDEWNVSKAGGKRVATLS